MTHRKLLRQARGYLDRLKKAKSPLYEKTEHKMRKCNRQMNAELKRLSA